MLPSGKSIGRGAGRVAQGATARHHNLLSQPSEALVKLQPDFGDNIMWQPADAPSVLPVVRVTVDLSPGYDGTLRGSFLRGLPGRTGLAVYSGQSVSGSGNPRRRRHGVRCALPCLGMLKEETSDQAQSDQQNHRRKIEPAHCGHYTPDGIEQRLGQTADEP